MIRLIAAAGFALAVATSAQAITPAPITQPDGMITQVRFGCGPGRTRVAGVCVARTTIRHTSRPQGLLLSARHRTGVHHKPPSGPSASSTLIHIKIQHHLARKLACGVRQSLRPSLSRLGRAFLDDGA